MVTTIGLLTPTSMLCQVLNHQMFVMVKRLYSIVIMNTINIIILVVIIIIIVNLVLLILEKGN